MVLAAMMIEPLRPCAQVDDDDLPLVHKPAHVEAIVGRSKQPLQDDVVAEQTEPVAGRFQKADRLAAAFLHESNPFGLLAQRQLRD